MTAKKILVLGSVNADHVLDVQSFPTPGETMVGSNYRVVAGGKGANQAVACARLGGTTAFLACVGNDPEGLDTIASLATDGMDTSRIEVTKNGRTGVALIFVNVVIVYCCRRKAKRDMNNEMQMQIESAVSQYFALTQKDGNSSAM